MQILLNKLRGQQVAEGKRGSLAAIADATGINRNTLTEISKGRLKTLRPEYIDALCAYFGVSACELVEAEPIALPVAFNIRPDRAGHRVGDKTKEVAG